MEGAAVGPGPLERELRDDPSSFSFFQAVWLLERLRRDRSGVGLQMDPADEVVRFSAQRSIAFPPSEIQSLEMDGDGPARMVVNFMGLTGPQGVLPYHYTLLAVERARARDLALADFLDLFHHRILSLFYRAWKKHRFALADGEDRLREHLLDLVGMGLEGFREALPFPTNLLAFYAGLLSPQQRGAAALQQLLEDFFGVPVEIDQFVGAWHALPERDQCAVGEENGPSTQLGLGAVVGDEIWDPQTRVRIRLGPLTREQYDRFLPTGKAFEDLRQLSRFFSNDQFEFEVQLVLARDQVPPFILGDESATPQPLGWSTWLGSAAFTRDADETVLTL